jgi:hypothetical protein
MMMMIMTGFFGFVANHLLVKCLQKYFLVARAYLSSVDRPRRSAHATQPYGSKANFDAHSTVGKFAQFF